MGGEAGCRVEEGCVLLSGGSKDGACLGVCVEGPQPETLGDTSRHVRQLHAMMLGRAVLLCC